jgi:GDP-4-dehydro-6-deoxy-D-mannose reductase
MKVLITGITGMAGSHLAEYLLKKGGYDVHGTIRWRSNREHIRHIEKQLSLHECELRDPYAVLPVLKTVRPDYIYHLASQSRVATSWISPQETLINNITGQLNLLEAVRHLDLTETRIHVAGSSEAYGMVEPNEIPVKETNSLKPLSPYGVSKMTQDALAYQYAKSYELKIIRTRAFNHTGPRRGDVFVTSDFARQIVEIEMGRRKPIIHVGNLAARRDFTDIRDVVRAYVLALETCEPGDVFNIGSGKAYAIQEVLDILLAMCALNIEVKKDPKRMRPSDMPLMVCDNTLFCQQTGWQPEISFEQSLSDLLDYWRIRLRRCYQTGRPECMPQKVTAN